MHAAVPCSVMQCHAVSHNGLQCHAVPRLPVSSLANFVTVIGYSSKLLGPVANLRVLTSWLNLASVTYSETSNNISHVTRWPHSSVGKSVVLITRRSWVRSPLGPILFFRDYFFCYFKYSWFLDKNNGATTFSLMTFSWNVISNGKERKSCLGRVYNFKLGSFTQ
jgi:hypothetical protein